MLHPVWLPRLGVNENHEQNPEKYLCLNQNLKKLVDIKTAALTKTIWGTTTYLSCCCVASVVSDSVRPHRRKPTSLPRPWDSPGKNTGVGCHFLLQCMKVKSESEVSQSCPTLSNPMNCSLPVSSIHGIFQARVLEWGAIAFSHTYPSMAKIKKIDYSKCWQGCGGSGTLWYCLQEWKWYSLGKWLSRWLQS